MRLFGKMVEHLIRKCEEKGLNVLATASDGQWHKFGVRNSNDMPLTAYQLQKDLWKKYKSQPKAKLLSEIQNLNKVKSLDDDVYMNKLANGSLIVYGHMSDTPLTVYKDTPCIFFSQKPKGDDLTSNLATDSEKDNNVSLDELSAFLPDRLTKTLGTESFDELQGILSNPPAPQIMPLNHEVESFHFGDYLTALFGDKDEALVSSMGEVCEFPYNYPQTQDLHEDCNRQENLTSLNDVSSHSVTSAENTPHYIVDEQLVSDSVQVLHDAFDSMYGETFDNGSDTNCRYSDEHSRVSLQDVTNNCDNYSECLFQYNPMDRMVDPQNVTPDTYTENIQDLLTMLQHTDDDRKKVWLNMNTFDIKTMLNNKENACKMFLKRELMTCLNSVKNRRQLTNFKFSSSWNKSKLYDSLMVALKSSEFSMVNPVKCTSRRINPEKLSKLSSKVINKMSKDVLLICLCQDKWPHYYRQWAEKSPVKKVIVKGCEIQNYFSQPKVDLNGKVRFHFTDACHILTCLRTKICTTGISGLRKIAWEKAAKSKDTRLNVAIVLECIDKQSVAFAKRVFGEDVEIYMDSHGFQSEARFIKLVRQWFEAEDDSGITSTDRCLRRLNLRYYLLHNVNFGKFPPQTQYIKGIPSVTYEALLVHIERKLQIYGHIPSRSYNVRSLGTQEVEQFFSTMRDLDPSGLGTPKPDDIPDMMATAAWLDNIRMDPSR